MNGIYNLLGITPHFCIPANARAKNIERFFWTQEMHFQRQFPTYRGINTTKRPQDVDTRIAQGQVMEWDEIKECLGHYLDRYNREHKHTGHGMYGRSPDQVWTEYFIMNEQRMVAPSSLRLLMMKSRRLKVGRFGIRLLGNFYHADLLMDYQGNYVVTRYDPDDLTTIYAYSMNDEYLCMCERRHRVAWNDEVEYKNLKSLQKRRLKAMREERKAAEEIVKVEFGYDRHDLPDPETDPPPVPDKPPKIIRLTRTPFDNVQKKINLEKEQKESRIASATGTNDATGNHDRTSVKASEPPLHKQYANYLDNWIKERNAREAQDEEPRTIFKMTINSKSSQDDEIICGED